MNEPFRRIFPTRAPALLLLPFLVAACIDDPTGPSALSIRTVGASPDTMWIGAPGEPIPTGVAIRITNLQNSEPVAGATVTWESFGPNGVVVHASAQSDAKGLATAVWQLGTSAGEQQLLVSVRSGQRTGELKLRALAVPHVVAQLRISVDSLTVVRLGDSLPISVTAVDPYGNVFAPPAPRLSSSDTTVGTVAGSVFLAGPRRGATELEIVSNYVNARIPLRVVQHVAAIVPQTTALRFTSLGAELPIRYAVLDDRGRVVADTTAALSVADTMVAQLSDTLVRAAKTGSTELRFTVGTATTTIPVAVQQRIASLRLQPDSIRFDALRDTATFQPVAVDSLGFPIPNPDLVYELSDGQVVTLAGASLLEAAGPGVSLLTLRDPVTSVSVMMPIVVQQRVSAIHVAPITFDALGDTLPIAAMAVDRLGSTVVGASLTYSTSDPGVATIEPGGRLRSQADGYAVVTVSDLDNWTTGTAAVIVAQQVASLTVSAESLAFDALGDSVPLSFVARDRLGSLMTTARASYSSSDALSAEVSVDGVVRSRSNGSTMVICQSQHGPSDTVNVVVAQRVSRIQVDRDTLLFESLNAVLQVPAIPVDRLGSPVAGVGLIYSVDDPSVVDVDSAGRVRAVANGSAELVVASGRDTARVLLRVTQRPVLVVFPSDTIRFTALNDTVSLQATGLDSLGSPVTNDISVAVLDSSVVELAGSTYVRSRGNGVTSATVTAGGITGQIAVIVDQVATNLTVAVDYPSEVVAISVGDILPLNCQATDRNNFPISRSPVFEGARRGTVSGTHCNDLRVTRAGYDSLSFAINGVRTTIPVIVASAPDSVGVVAAAQPLPDEFRIRFVGEDLAHPSILALQPLVQDILTAYGNPTDQLGKARALRDWIARMAVHPHPPLHPGNSTSNRSVLPIGKSWAEVNAIGSLKFEEDRQYWYSVGYDGYAMLDRLLGTLDPNTGLRAADGMMERVNRGHYRIRNIDSYRYVLCTFQAIMLNALWAAAGLHGTLASTVGHDPAAVFIPELNQWVYEDPTFNEEYLLDGTGTPMSPEALLAYTTAGQVARLRPLKFQGPDFDPEPYIPSWSYLSEHPEGMVIMGSQLNSRVVGIGGWPPKLVQIDVPRLALESPFNRTSAYAPVQPDTAFPTLGVAISALMVEDSTYIVHLNSTFPNHKSFERRMSGGAWTPTDSIDVLPVGECRVEYRSVDGLGNMSSVVVLDVWLPRATGFTQSGDPEGLRRSTGLCVT